MDSQEIRLQCFKRAKWRCEICGLPLVNEKAIPQLAHIVKQSKYNIKRYTKEVIHHPDNIKVVCGLTCNSKVDLGFADELIRVHLEKIMDKIKNA